MLQVWESREKFNESNSGTHPLLWFPSTAPLPERKSLISLVELFTSLPCDQLKFTEPILEQLKVVIIFLNFFEEVSCLIFLDCNNYELHLQNIVKIHKI